VRRYNFDSSYCILRISNRHSMYNTSKLRGIELQSFVLEHMYCASLNEWFVSTLFLSFLIETTAMQDCIHRNCRFVSQVLRDLFRWDPSINPETETKTKPPRASQPGFQLCCQTQYYYNTPASSKLTHGVSPRYTARVQLRTTVFCCNNKKQKTKKKEQPLREIASFCDTRRLRWT